MNGEDYTLDLSGRPAEPAKVSPREAWPFLSVWFNCCKAYQRVYRSADGTRYVGHCPRCARAVRFKVGPGGTGQRRFVVE